MVFTFIAHDSINLNAQCAEVDIVLVPRASSFCTRGR